MRDDKETKAPHPGPRIDRIPVAGVGGLIFVVGVMAIVLVGVPASRWFLAGAAVLGIVIAIVLKITDKAA